MAALPLVRPSSSVAPTGENLLQHGARALSGILGQKEGFQALTVIMGLASIPVINQVQLDGSWVATVGKGIKDHTILAKLPVSLMAGYAVLGALKIWAGTLEAPIADKAQHTANEASFDTLTNAIQRKDQQEGDFSKLSLLVRFHQIMNGFDKQLHPETTAPTIVEKPPAAFSAPFTSAPDSAKPGETFSQHLGRWFSNLSFKRTIDEQSASLHALGVGCTIICHQILPKLQLTGTWTKAVSETVHKWKLLKGAAGLGTGYVAMVALKSLLNRLKAPNEGQVAKAKLIATLAQLSYAMHEVETRGERGRLAVKFKEEALDAKVLAIPCSKEPLLVRFNNIIRDYSTAVNKKLGPAKPAEKPAEPASSTAGADAPFTDEELAQFITQFGPATEVEKKNLIRGLSSAKKTQILELMVTEPKKPPGGPSKKGSKLSSKAEVLTDEDD